jgi:hypothetical protein
MPKARRFDNLCSKMVKPYTKTQSTTAPYLTPVKQVNKKTSYTSSAMLQKPEYMKLPGINPEATKLSQLFVFPNHFPEEEYIFDYCIENEVAYPTFKVVNETGYIATFRKFRTASLKESLYESRKDCIMKIYRFIKTCQTYLTYEQQMQFKQLRQKHGEPTYSGYEIVDSSLEYYRSVFTCGEFTISYCHIEEGVSLMKCVSAYYTYLINKELELQYEQSEKEALVAVGILD